MCILQCYLVTFLISISFFAHLTTSQLQLLAQNYAYDLNSKGINISCNDQPWTNTSVQFKLDGTIIFHSEKLNETANFVQYDPNNNKSIVLLTRDRRQGFRDLSCTLNGSESENVTIFSVNSLKLTIKPKQMSVNQSSTFTCEWDVEPNHLNNAYYALIEYNTTNETSANTLTTFVPNTGIKTGLFAKDHWAVSLPNFTNKFEFNARLLNQSSIGTYFCILDVGNVQKERFVSTGWKSSSAMTLSHQFAAFISLLFVMVSLYD